MDERAIKRLLVILAVSIITIFLFKAMMTNTFVNLNKAATEKQQAAAKPPDAQQEEIPVSDAAVVFEATAASSVGEAPGQETSALSGVSGVSGVQ